MQAHHADVQLRHEELLCALCAQEVKHLRKESHAVSGSFPAASDADNAALLSESLLLQERRSIPDRDILVIKKRVLFPIAVISSGAIAWHPPCGHGATECLGGYAPREFARRWAR